MALQGKFQRIADQVGQNLADPALIPDEPTGQEHVII